VTLTLNDPIDSTIQMTNYEYDRRKHQTKIIDANQGETKYRRCATLSVRNETIEVEQIATKLPVEPTTDSMS
jgi:hypothetical protein